MATSAKNQPAGHRRAATATARSGPDVAEAVAEAVVEAIAEADLLVPES